jgi:hypothetical protein
MLSVQPDVPSTLSNILGPQTRGWLTFTT